MFCPMCGAPNEDDAEYCGNCGAALHEEAAGEPAVETVKEGSESIDVQVEGPVDEVREEAAPKPGTEVPPAPPARSYSAPRPAAGVPTSGMAIASLVAGIGGLTVLPLLASIVAIVLGYMARRDIRDRPGEVTGEGVALAGIVLGWIAVGLAILGIIVVGGIALCAMIASVSYS